MTAKALPRTQSCSAAQGRTRLEHARKFLDVAELVAGEGGGGDLEYASAAAALAVLAGIAASDLTGRDRDGSEPDPGRRDG